MTRTARIEELMRILEQRPWTAEEEREVRMIIGDDDRQSQFEIEGDWPSESKYDKPKKLRDLPGGTPVTLRWEDAPKDTSPLPTSRPGEFLTETDIRLAQLEATTKDLFAKLKALEDKLGVGKE